MCSAFLIVHANEKLLLEQDLDLKRRDFKKLLVDFSAALDELERAKASFDDEKKQSSELGSQVQTLSDRLAVLQKEINTKHSTEKDLKSRLAAEKIKNQEMASKALKLRASSHKTQEEKERTIKSLLQENTMIMSKLTQEKIALEKEIKKLKKDLDNNFLVAQNEALIKHQQKLEVDFKDVTRQAEGLKKFLATAKTKLTNQYSLEREESMKKIAALEADFFAKQDSLKALNTSFLSLKDENDTLSKKLLMLNDENRRLRSENSNVTLKFLQDRVNIECKLGEKLSQVRQLALDSATGKKKKLQALIETNLEKSERLSQLEQDNQIMSAQINLLSQKLFVSKKTAKSAATKLFNQLKIEQLNYSEKLAKLKKLVGSRITLKDQKIVSFGNKTEAMMLELIEQKKRYSKMFEDLQLAQTSLDVLKSAQSKQDLTPEEKEDQRVSRLMAKNIEKLSTEIAKMTTHKEELSKQLQLAKNESDILKSSVDEIYKSNDRLTNENQQLKTKFESSENSLLAMQDKTRELVKREAELIERIVNFENQVTSKNSSGKKNSLELDQKLQLARADYAQLKAEVQTLVTKLTASSQLVSNLSKEADDYKTTIAQVQNDGIVKEELIASLKNKMRALLSKIGLQEDLLGDDAKTEYLRLVADHQIELLTESVLVSGKGKMAESLQVVLENDELINRMIERLANYEQQLKAAMSQTNFGQIFSSIQRCKIHSEISKLYGLFLARASTGKGADDCFSKFKKIVAQHFSEPEIEELDITNLIDPKNLIMLKINS